MHWERMGALDFSSVVPQPAAVVVLAIALGLFLLYRAALPKPLPGIPYNDSAAARLFGDVPGMLSHINNQDGTFITYLESTLRNLNAPLVQIFIKPMSKPLLVLADYHEARDVMSHRTSDFDRSTSSGDLVRGLGSSHHIHLRTGPVWRAQRRLIQDLMTPSFLNKVAGPVMHQNAALLIDLWEVKSRLAAGQPWAASDDIDHVATDAVLVFAFGKHFGDRHSSTRRALEAARIMDPPKPEPLTINGSRPVEVVKFPKGAADEAVRASLELVAAVEDVQGSPLPDLKWLYINCKPRIRKATKIKEDYIRRELEDAIERLQRATGEEFVKSAVDHMVFRENTLAIKESRKPNFFSRVMMDEIFGFIVAGNDTSSTSISWALKYLTDNGSVQSKLRTSLEAAIPDALREGRLPSFEEITTGNHPYLNAVVEETLRCSATVPVVDRQALADTQLLGYHIPKNTVVTCLVTGPSMMSPAFEIDETRRSKSGRSAKDGIGKRAWNDRGMDSFQPERWLVGPDGDFDATAGPQLAFGLGTRQCFGKRLALLEMRILITLIVWSFELLPCPPELSGSKPILIMTNRPKDCYVRLQKVQREAK